MPSSLCRPFCAALLALGAIAFDDSAAAAQSIEQMGLYSVSLDIKTCDRDDAASSDDVMIRLTDASTVFLLDSIGPDRERGRWDYYEITFPKVAQVRDITRLQIQKNGTNAWCIEHLKLQFNGGPNVPNTVFERDFPNGLWIDGNDGYQPTVTWNYGGLRNSPTWNVAGARVGMCRPPTWLSNILLRDKIEGVVSHANWLAGEPLYWSGLHGDEYVEMWRKDNDSLEIDLDMKADVEWNVIVDLAKNPNVDVNMQADVSCSNATKQLSVNVFTTDVTISDGGIFQGIYDVLDDTVDDLASGMKLKFNETLPQVVSCPAITIYEESGIGLNWGTTTYAGQTFAIKDLPVLCYLP